MHATNTSSIKSPLVWQATLQPSKLFAAIYWSFVLLSLAALWQCPLHWSIRTLLLLVTCLGAVVIFLPTRKSTSIALCENDSWQLIGPSAQASGYLATGSYRSMLLIVIAIKPALGPVQHAVIWRDAVSAVDFSTLHIRLALTPAHQLH